MVFIWLLVLASITVCTQATSDIQVEISQGILQGEVLDLVTGDGTYYSFKGIPYAQAPINELRFKEPQAAPSWDGVRDATKHGSVCYSFSDLSNTVSNGSEDCLFLNVYTPDFKPDELMPVVVFIHGGYFKYGNGDSQTYGPDFLLRKGVVVVTFNYRTEIFGFLSIENDEVPGNAGLKDQVAVLEWVQSNIKKFGGDANNVMIFGQGAGSASAAFHMLSPLSKGLFQKAIMQSGSPLSGWAMTPEPRRRAFALGKKTGLDTKDDVALLTHLRSLPKEDLVNAQIPLTPWDSISNYFKLTFFGPVVENSTCGFLTMHPIEYVTSGQVNNVNYMIGYNSEEGILATTKIREEFELLTKYVEYFTTSLITYHDSITENLDIAEEIKTFMLAGQEPTLSNLTNLIKFYSASAYKYDILKFNNLLSNKTSLTGYMYELQAITERNVFGNTIGVNVGANRVCHNDDLPYLFNMESLGLGVNQTADSFKVIEYMTTLWTNFAKYGNPTPDTSLLGFQWPIYDTTNQEYIFINTNTTLTSLPYYANYLFWDSIYTKVFAS